eukprot:gene16467-18101_t
MRVYIYKKAKDVPAGYYILCLTKAEELQCSAPSLVHSSEIEEMWKDKAIKEKYNKMAKRLKEEIREKGSAKLVVDWRGSARYESVSNRFASAKATEKWLNQQASDDDDDFDDMRLFEDMFVNDHF